MSYCHTYDNDVNPDASVILNCVECVVPVTDKEYIHNSSSLTCSEVVHSTSTDYCTYG